jgi:WD40 repeat protein
MDETLRMWDAYTGKELWSVEHDSYIWCCAYSPDGSTIISGSDDGTLHMWDASTRKELWSVRHADSVECCAYSPDGSIVISGSDDKTLRMWDAHTEKELWSVENDDRVRCCAYSPDGSTVLSGSEDKTLRMWSNPLAQWSPSNHWSRSANTKIEIETLFQLRETGECQLSLLPTELMLELCKYL